MCTCAQASLTLGVMFSGTDGWVMKLSTFPEVGEKRLILLCCGRAWSFADEKARFYYRRELMTWVKALCPCEFIHNQV